MGVCRVPCCSAFFSPPRHTTPPTHPLTARFRPRAKGVWRECWPPGVPAVVTRGLEMQAFRYVRLGVGGISRLNPDLSPDDLWPGLTVCNAGWGGLLDYFGGRVGGGGGGVSAASPFWEGVFRTRTGYALSAVFASEAIAGPSDLASVIDAGCVRPEVFGGGRLLPISHNTVSLKSDVYLADQRRLRGQAPVSQAGPDIPLSVIGAGLADAPVVRPGVACGGCGTDGVATVAICRDCWRAQPWAFLSLFANDTGFDATTGGGAIMAAANARRFFSLEATVGPSVVPYVEATLAYPPGEQGACWGIGVGMRGRGPAFLVGSDDTSWGLHADGELIHNNTAMEFHPFAMEAGSTLGCGWDPITESLFFTRNGAVVAGAVAVTDAVAGKRACVLVCLCL